MTLTAGHRLTWVDVARGLALVSMFVAHTAPTGGPDGVLNLSEHLTAALFAALVGVSAHLEQRRQGFWRAFLRAVVRAAALCGAAWLTSHFGAAVVDVLTHLAVLTVLMSVLALLPGLVQLLLVPAAAWAGVRVGALTADDVAARLEPARALVPAQVRPGPAVVAEQAAAFFTAGPYFLLFFTAWALLGAVVVRSVQGGGLRAALRLGGHPGPGLGGRAAGGVWAGVGLLVGGAGVALARQRTGDSPVPYEATWDYALLAAGLVLIVLGACAAVVPSHVPWLTAVLAVPGSMTLSVYVAHQAYLGWVLRAGPGPWLSELGTDDTWFNVGALCAAGLLLPLLWRALVRAEPWRRGPLEGPVALVTHGLARR